MMTEIRTAVARALPRALTAYYARPWAMLADAAIVAVLTLAITAWVLS
jgi:hypothetical protein